MIALALTIMNFLVGFSTRFLELNVVPAVSVISTQPRFVSCYADRS